MKNMKNRIYIVGYGVNGDLSGMTIEAYSIIKAASRIYCRMDCDPIFQELRRLGKKPISLYRIYRRKSFQYKEVYEVIAHFLSKELEKHTKIVYLVPGHPLVCESPTEEIIKLSKKGDFEVELVSGVSFMEAIFAKLGFDPGHGFQHITSSQLYDACTKRKFSRYVHTLISCVSHIPQQGLEKTEYEVTLEYLRDVYPPNHRIAIVFSPLSGNHETKIIETAINKLQDHKRIMEKNRASIFIRCADYKHVLDSS